MIAVCGPNEASDAEREQAATVGRLLAEAGQTLVCGGRGGVMEAASRGAKEAGGTTIGILPGYDRSAANQWIDHAIPTGMGEARNVIVVASGDSVIAVGGGFGTLSEVALALKLGKTVVTLGGWDLPAERVAAVSRGQARLLPAADAVEAVRLALEAAAPRPGHG
jgi:uncharacterized protein (TIGR00725 family)